jgi:2'-5' RNA ligase
MYTIIAPVPKHLAAAIAPYRRRFDSQANLIPPHLSILSPFEFAGQPEALEWHLDDIGESHAPIKVALVSWDVLENGGYELRLPVMAGRPELEELYRNLLTGPLSAMAGQQPAYAPHLSLGRLATPGEIERARAALAGFEPHFSFRVGVLELWQRAETGQPWQYRKKFSRKATVAGRLRGPARQVGGETA